jgi:hypothetical protein
MRDQRHAVVALETAGEHEALAAANTAPAPAVREDQDDAPDATAIPVAPPEHVATVERGRIASLAGIVTLIWLVILVLMIWNS